MVASWDFIGFRQNETTMGFFMGMKSRGHLKRGRHFEIFEILRLHSACSWVFSSVRNGGIILVSKIHWTSLNQKRSDLVKTSAPLRNVFCFSSCPQPVSVSVFGDIQVCFWIPSIKVSSRMSASARRSSSVSFRNATWRYCTPPTPPPVRTHTPAKHCGQWEKKVINS